MQNKDHYAIQGRSFTNFGTNRKFIYDFLLVINTNLPPILHFFWDIVFDGFKIAIFGLKPLTEGFLWDDLRKIFRGCQQMSKAQNGTET